MLCSPLDPPTYDQWLRARNLALAAQALNRRLQARVSLLPFMQEFVQADLSVSPFLLHLVAALEKFVRDCEAGLSPRLMVFAPPRHGKSHAISRALPAYILGRNPRWEIIAASATQDLADEFGLHIRNTLNNPIFQDLFPACALDPSSNAVSRLTTLAKGGYRALGVGTQVVGRGANVLIIDDPIAGRKEAYSPTERTALKNWYTSNARTRLAPGAGMVIMHQRWHTEDLASTLLDLAKHDPLADQWQVLSYPAICEDPDTDPLGRPHGEALDPNRWPVTTLAALKATLSPVEWAAMFQQSPFVETGNFFSRDTINWYDDDGVDFSSVNWMLGADYSTSSKATSDNTAVVAGGLDADREVYIHPDLIYGKLDPEDAVAQTVTYAKTLGTHALAHERGVIANLLAPSFRREMKLQDHFLSTEHYTRSTGKHVYAMALKAMLPRMHFPVSRRSLIEPLLLRFAPNSDGEDDLIDALVSIALTIDKAVMPPSGPVTQAETTEDEDDDARWEKIMAGGEGARQKPGKLYRLNGEPFS